MKTRNKSSFLKYFKPTKNQNILSEETFEVDLEEDLGHLAFQKKSNALFLSRFNENNILELMNKVGLTKHLNSLGLDNFQVDIEKDESQINYLKVYYQEKEPQNLLIDLRVSETRFIPDKDFFENDNDVEVLDMVVIEWLSAQHPYKSFDHDRPQLPGQKNPGLGSLNYLMELMYLAGKKIYKDGFMDIPEHFHGATMYSKKFKFFNPVSEAILRAVLRDLQEYSLAELAWGVITETIIDSTTNKPFIYESSEQIFPLSKFMKDYFNSKKYQETFNQVYKSQKFDFNYDKMLELRQELLQENNPEDL